MAELTESLAWAAVLILLFASAFFSIGEAALFSLGAIRLGKMEEKGSRAAETIRRITEVPRRLIVTLILGNETANMACAVLVAWAVVSFPSRLTRWPGLPETSSGLLVVSIVLSVPGILILGQTLPKALGVSYSEALARAFAYPLWIFMRASFPLRWTFRSMADLLLQAIGAYPDRSPHSSLADEDLRELVEESSREGLLDVTERELLVNLLRSEDISAADIMTPRHEIVSVSADAGVDEVRALMDREDYSRFPVYEGDREHMVGVVTAKDLLKFRLAEREGRALSCRDLMREPQFVPESRKIRDLLLDFRRLRSHLALVVDEFGSLSGLVTLEDVLEEIFGEVKEDDEPELVNLGEDHWRVLGRMEIADFNTRTGAAIPRDGVRTLAGLVLARLGRKPRPGDEVKIQEFSFKVLEAKGITVNRLEVMRGPGG